MVILNTCPPYRITILNDVENQIIELFPKVITHFHLKTELRIAGGWVRDKLLGKECNDIDIVVDNIPGSQFVEKLDEYLILTGEQQTRGKYIVQRNPDKSKHLETATIRFSGVEIDIVNLRTQDYSQTIGTIEEDAKRRDFTINSLFYNIRTREIEDWTGRGLEDLKAGRIVTPLPAKKTFLDDPLRVLRAIRFSATLVFTLDEELKIAAADTEVKAAFANKISRERVGHEVNLIISGNNPVDAMTYIFELQVFPVVFCLPPNMEHPSPAGYERLCVAYMGSAWSLLQLVGCSSFTAEQLRLCLYAALFVPFRNALYKDKKGKEVKMMPVGSYILCTSLKLKHSDAVTVRSLHLAAEKFLSLIPFIMSGDNLQVAAVDWKQDIIDVPAASKLRILAGLLLREIKEFWHCALVVSLLLYPRDICSSGNLSAKQSEREEIYDRVVDSIMEMGLENVWELKPLVDGNVIKEEITSFLQLYPRRQLIGEWKQKILQWQLAHPSGTADECLNWMKNSVTALMG